jgi:hypothetical protein
MAKTDAKKLGAKKRRRDRSGGPSLFTPPVIDIGRTLPVSSTPTKDEESVFTLSDGTKLYARVAITSVERSREKYNPNGEPIYQIQAGIILRTEVARSLKRKLKTS